MIHFTRCVLEICLKCLSVAGISRGPGEEILRAIWHFKSRLFFLLLLLLFIPFMEFGVLGGIYILLSHEKQGKLVSYLQSHGVCGVFDTICNPDKLAYWIIGGSALLLVLRIGMNLLRGYLLSDLYYGTYVRYAQRLLSAYVNADPRTAQAIDKNRVANAVILEAANFGLVAMELVSMASDLSIAFVLFIGAGFLSPKLLLMSVGLGIFLVFLNRSGYRKALAISRKKLLVQTDMLGHIYDILWGYVPIKLEGGEKRVLKDSSRYLSMGQRWRFDRKWNEVVIKNNTEACLLISLLLVIGVSVVFLRLEAAFLFTFMVLMSRLQKLVLATQDYWMQMKRAIPSLDFVHGLLSGLSTEVSREPGRMSAADLPSPFNVRLEKVNFRYPDGPGVLKDISLDLNEGDRILIQGESGQGKSTLLLLLLGMLSPTEGRILIGGKPLDRETFYGERQRFAYAAPDVYLLRKSLRENLLLAGDFSDKELDEALFKARLNGVVERLEGGLDGPIGENGRNLSLGERQRILLARIFLKNPRLVVMDEATSNLNLEMEEEILRDLMEGLPGDAILVFASHREPKVIPFDRRFTLKEGRLRELAAQQRTMPT